VIRAPLALALTGAALVAVPATADGRPRCFGEKATTTLHLAGHEKTVVDEGQAEDGPAEIGTPKDDVIVSRVAFLFIDAGAGDDRVCGSASTVVGGNGRDMIEVHGDDLVASGERGNDTLIVKGPSIVVSGEGGNDLLDLKGATKTGDGGPGDDVIDDSGGRSDQMSGGAGNDVIISTRGGRADNPFDDDLLDGGDGDDRIQAGDGGATIAGGPGADTLRGGDGPDSLDGGPGTDVDVCRGGRGPDTAVGCEQVTGVP
jgi:Ca2+-binding RTX toxin-like protein